MDGKAGVKRVAALSALCVSMLLAACATAQVATMGQGRQEAVWVCHGNRNPRWLKVAAPAADGHRKHGDRVSTTPRPEKEPCRR